VKESKKLKSLKGRNPTKKIDVTEVYFIGDDKPLVTIPFILRVLGISRTSLNGWEHKGLEASEYSTHVLKLFDFEYIKEWYADNIDKKLAKGRRNKITEVDGEPEDSTIPKYDNMEDEINDIYGKIKQANEILQIKKTPQYEAERIDKIMAALTKAAKLGEQMGELIPKKDTEKIIVEMIATLISGYKKDINILPQECSNRTENEIRNILEVNYRSNIENYQKLSKSELVSETKLFDVLTEVNDILLGGVPLDDVIAKLKELV